MPTYTVTCHTAECGNDNHAITSTLDTAPDYWACGVCGNVITDVTHD